MGLGLRDVDLFVHFALNPKPYIGPLKGPKYCTWTHWVGAVSELQPSHPKLEYPSVGYLGPLVLAHVDVTPRRKKDPSFLNIRNSIPQKVQRIPNIDPVLLLFKAPQYRSNSDSVKLNKDGREGSTGCTKLA